VSNNEDQAKLEKLLFGRREFLLAGGGLLLSTSVLSLIGCGGNGGGFGGGGNGGGQGTIANLSGTVALPAGFSNSVGPLKVSNILGSGAVGAGNGFNVSGIAGGPSLVYLQDASGKVILMGFLDPSTGKSTINALSTAVALLYFAFDAYAMPINTRSQIVSLIQANPATVTFANVIAKRVAADPFAVSDGDTQISAALKVAFNAIKPKTPKLLRRPTTVGGGNETIQPAGIISGTEMLQASTAGFIATNHYRRYCQIYVYKTGTTDHNDVTTTLTKVAPVGTITSLAPTEGLSLFTSLADVFTGGAPYNPVSSPTIPLALDAGTKKTFFDIVEIGSSFDQTEPAFFSMSKYAAVVSEWRATVITLTLKSWFVDVLFSLVLDGLGVKVIFVNDAGITAAIQGLTAIQDAAWQNALFQARTGQFGKAAIGAVQSMVDNTLVANKFFASLTQVAGSAQAAAALATKQASFATYLGVTVRVLANVMAATFGALGVGDMAAVSTDLLNSHQGDVWTAVLNEATLILSPTAKTVVAGSTVAFTVKPPIGIVQPPNTTIVYDWTQDGVLSTLSDGNGIIGQGSIESSSTTVNLITTPSQQGLVKVTVTGYFKRPGGIKTAFGTAEAAITMGTGSTIPATIQVVKYEVPSGGDFVWLTCFAFKPVSGASSDTVYTLVGSETPGTILQSEINAGAPAMPPNPPTLHLPDSMFYQHSDHSPTVFLNLGNGIVGRAAFQGFTGTDEQRTTEINFAVAAMQKLGASYTVT
jgi:hypothetical protein